MWLPWTPLCLRKCSNSKRLDQATPCQFQVVSWDAKTFDDEYVLWSDDLQRMRLSPETTWRNVISADPTNDFTVRVTNLPHAPHPGSVFVGFTTQTAFAADNSINTAKGVYTMRLEDGALYGTEQKFVDYSAAFKREDGTLRCVADRSRGTIAFHVDGVDLGVAWTGVGPLPLYAVVIFWFHDVEIELL